MHLRGAVGWVGWGEVKGQIERAVVVGAWRVVAPLSTSSALSFTCAISPMMAVSSDVLPLPVAPTTTTSCPIGTSRLTSEMEGGPLESQEKSPWRLMADSPGRGGVHGGRRGGEVWRKWTEEGGCAREGDEWVMSDPLRVCALLPCPTLSHAPGFAEGRGG
jgi:hypothetical protein